MIRKLTRIFSAVCIAVVLAVQTAFSAAAELSLAEECFGYFSKQNGAEDFWDGLEYGGADWAAYCRGRLYGARGAEKYAASAEDYVAELARSGGFVPPTNYQKAAVCIAAAGGNPEQAVWLGVFGNEQLDRQGFNAYIWGLIAANVTGIIPPDNSVNTPETLAEHIISRQHEDGSFSLIGGNGDVDITAAAVYALFGSGIDKAEKAARRGAEWLCGIEGGYSSMGVRNCESTAQAVIALCAAGLTDEAREAANQLEDFHKPGGYSHLAGGEISAFSTVQALEAFAALELSDRGEMLFGRISSHEDEGQTYQPDFPDNTGATGAIGTTGATSVTDTTHDTDTEILSGEGGSSGESGASEISKGFTGTHIKIIISAVLGAGALCVLLFLARRKKAAVPAAVLLAALAGGVWLLDIRTPEEYYSGSDAGTMRVTVSAECSSALDNMDKIDQTVNPAEVIPEDGQVVSLCEVSLPEGASAFDALISAARSQQVRVDYTGGVYGTYVRGIGYIYELGFGDMSGWLYKVNSEYPEISASDYSLKEGDIVEFVYTCSLGADVGNNFTSETNMR